MQVEPMTYSADRLTNLITPISSTAETPPQLVEAYKKQLPSSDFTELDRVIPRTCLDNTTLTNSYPCSLRNLIIIH